LRRANRLERPGRLIELPDVDPGVVGGVALLQDVGRRVIPPLMREAWWLALPAPALLVAIDSKTVLSFARTAGALSFAML
jgi:hypothetical protein